MTLKYFTLYVLIFLFGVANTSNENLSKIKSKFFLNDRVILLKPLTEIDDLKVGDILCVIETDENYLTVKRENTKCFGSNSIQLPDSEEFIIEKYEFAKIEKVSQELHLFSSDLRENLIREEKNFTHDESNLEVQVKETKKSEVKTQFIDADQTELTGGNKSLTVEKIQNTFTHPWVPGLRQKIVEGKSFDLNEFEQKKKIMRNELTFDDTIFQIQNIWTKLCISDEHIGLFSFEEDETQTEESKIFETKRPNTKKELIYAALPRIQRFCGSATKFIIRLIFQFLDAIRPENRKIMAHTSTEDRNMTFKLSSDYHLLVSAGFNCPLRLWNVKDGSLIRTFNDTIDTYFVSFISNNQQIVSVQDRAIRLWAVTTGELINTCELVGIAGACILSSDEKFILCDQEGTTIQMWSLETFLCVATFYGFPAHFFWFQFRNYNQEVLSASADNTIRVWDVTSQACKRVLAGHRDCVRSCSLSADQQFLASCSWDETVKIWRINTGKNIQTFREHSNCNRSSSNISPPGAFYSRKNQNDGRNGRIEACSFVSEDKCVASIDWGGRMFIWRVEDGSTVHTLNNIHTWCSCSMTDTWKGSYHVNIENSECLILFSNEHQIQVVEVESGRKAFTFNGHKDGIGMAVVTDDGRILISSGMDGTILFWDLKKNN